MASARLALGLLVSAAASRLGSACIFPVAGGHSPCCSHGRFSVCVSSLQVSCLHFETFLYSMALTPGDTGPRQTAWMPCKTAADCGWVLAKEWVWGGYKFLMISCVIWAHRELAAGPTDQSSCPNLPPAFCLHLDYLCTWGSRRCHPAPPALPHCPTNKALRKMCDQKPLSRELCGPALEIYTEQQVPKESLALAGISGGRSSRRFPAPGSCQLQKRGHQ